AAGGGAPRHPHTVRHPPPTTPGRRPPRPPRTEEMERRDLVSLLETGDPLDLYFGGNMETFVPLGGQVAGRIGGVESVKDILDATMDEFTAVIGKLAAQYV
ncbi:nitronate monooxygenase, partial [Mycobacteroides abscessus subsp. abscessus]